MGAVNTLFQNYPDPLSDNDTKKSDAYGLAYARFIETEWLYGARQDQKLIQRRSELQYLDSFRTGDVDTSKFKDILNVSQDKAWTAFDWTYFQIIPKFIDIIRDGYPIDIFEIQANGIDKQSMSRKERYRNNLETEMLAKPFTDAFTQATGMDFSPMGFVPETEEELDVHMDEFVQPQEIAIEICLAKIFDINHWENLYRLIIEDLITYGIGIARNIVDPSVGILQRRIDPQNFIYSFDPERTEDKRGCYYFGEVRIMKIEEIKKASGNKFSDEQLKSMINGSLGILGNPKDFRQEELYNYNVEVMEFCFETTLNETYKKKKYGKISKQKDTFEVHENSRSEKLQGTYDVWFEGFYITGTQFVYNYQLMHDMVRPNSDINNVMPPYSVFELSTPSMVKRMVSIADDLQITKLKIQQLISTAKPSGVSIDIDALAEVDLGNGDVLRVPDLIDIYNQRGDLLYSSRNLEGEYINGEPIKPIPGGISSELQQLIVYYNHNVKMLYDVTGVNPARDGSQSLDNTLVGAQQLAINASNTATKRILDGTMSILQRSSEFIVSRIQNMSMYGEKYNRAIMNLLGENNVKVLQEGSQLHMYEYSITIDVAPDAQERANFKATLDLAIQKGDIDIPDRIDLLNTRNLKLANKDLKIRIKKRRRQIQEEKLQQIKATEDGRRQTAIFVEKEKQRTFQMQMQADQAKITFEGRKEALLISKKTEGDALLLKMKYMYESDIENKKNNYLVRSDRMKEDRKDKRTGIQASQQSRMIDQRQKNTGSQDFETEQELKQFAKNAPIENQPLNLNQETQLPI